MPLPIFVDRLKEAIIEDVLDFVNKPNQQT